MTADADQISSDLRQTPARILVLEDDTLLRAALCDALLYAGFQVARAGNLTQLQQVLDSEDIDLILADYGATGALDSDGDGFQRFHAQTSDIPIVVLTGYGTVDAGSLSHLGVVDLIVKPFDYDDLVLRLRAALDRPAPGTIRPI